MTEHWAPIPGWIGEYEVSNRGRVRSCARVVTRSNGRKYTVSPRMRALIRVGKLGYLRVGLHRDGVEHLELVHRLVLSAFVGPCPDGMQGCHNDGDPANNGLENLRDTASGNQRDRVTHGNHWNASKSECDNGHVFDLTNTYMRPGGHRGCRACRRAADSRYRQKNKGN